MASVQSGRRGSRRRGRVMSDINVVPYIDVMLVLLVIFMVTAPFVPTGNIELPSVGRSSARPDAFIEIVVPTEGALTLRPHLNAAAAERTVERADLGTALRELAQGDPATPVLISADRNARYETVLDVMSEARQIVGPGGKVGLMAKPRSTR